MFEGNSFDASLDILNVQISSFCVRKEIFGGCGYNPEFRGIPARVKCFTFDDTAWESAVRLYGYLDPDPDL